MPLCSHRGVCAIHRGGDHSVWLPEPKPNLLNTTPALLTFSTVTSLLVLFWNFRRLQHHSPSGAFCLSVKTVVQSELQQCFKQSAHSLQNHAVCCCLWGINQPYIIIYCNNNSSFSFKKQYFGAVHFFRVIEHRFWKSFTYWFELRLVYIMFQLWLSVKDSLKEVYFIPDIYLVSHFLWWFCKKWLFTNHVARKKIRFFFFLICMWELNIIQHGLFLCYTTWWHRDLVPTAPFLT